MAAKLGAREVFLYEAAEVAGVAAKVLKANGARNCHLFPCHSTEMDDPPQGRCRRLRNARQLRVRGAHHRDAERRAPPLPEAGRRRHPAAARAVRGARHQRPHPSRAQRLGRRPGFDLSAAKTMSLNNIYVRTLAAEGAARCGGERACVGRHRLCRRRTARAARARRAGSSKSAATIYGFATWWTAELAPGIALSTAPGAPRTHWEQLYFPLLAPIAAKAGETVGIALRSRTSTRGRHARCLDRDAARRQRPRGRAPGAQSRQGVSAVTSGTRRAQVLSISKAAAMMEPAMASVVEPGGDVAHARALASRAAPCRAIRREGGGEVTDRPHPSISSSIERGVGEGGRQRGGVARRTGGGASAVARAAASRVAHERRQHVRRLRRKGRLRRGQGGSSAAGGAWRGRCRRRDCALGTVELGGLTWACAGHRRVPSLWTASSSVAHDAHALRTQSWGRNDPQLETATADLTRRPAQCGDDATTQYARDAGEHA